MTVRYVVPLIAFLVMVGWNTMANAQTVAPPVNTAATDGLRASKIIGTDVVNEQNEKIGDVDDLIITDNKVHYAIVDVGGFLGVGGRLVAVPYDSLTFSAARDSVSLKGATKSELEKLPEFRYPN